MRTWRGNQAPHLRVGCFVMPKKPAITTIGQECDETLESKQIPGHTHTCTGRHHEDADHYCGECHRFWAKGSGDQ